MFHLSHSAQIMLSQPSCGFWLKHLLGLYSELTVDCLIVRVFSPSHSSQPECNTVLFTMHFPSKISHDIFFWYLLWLIHLLLTYLFNYSFSKKMFVKSQLGAIIDKTSDTEMKVSPVYKQKRKSEKNRKEWKCPRTVSAKWNRVASDQLKGTKEDFYKEETLGQLCWSGFTFSEEKVTVRLYNSRGKWQGLLVRLAEWWSQKVELVGFTITT